MCVLCVSCFQLGFFPAIFFFSKKGFLYAGFLLGRCGAHLPKYVGFNAPSSYLCPVYCELLSVLHPFLVVSFSICGDCVLEQRNCVVSVHSRLYHIEL